jgi:hypothetical protein
MKGSRAGGDRRLWSGETEMGKEEGESPNSQSCQRQICREQVVMEFFIK